MARTRSATMYKFSKDINTSLLIEKRDICFNSSFKSQQLISFPHSGTSKILINVSVLHMAFGIHAAE